MGGCCSAPPGDELPLATEDELATVRAHGHLPVVAGPSVDFRGDNQLRTVYVAEYERGAELTFLFLDEDRPNACEDFLYDAIRRPLFGRNSDIETVLVVGDDVIFPGTYSADQTWNEKMPKHNETTVAMARFETRKQGASGDGDASTAMAKSTEEGGEREPFVLWINTWNHLLGERNNNTTMDITYQYAQPASTASEGAESKGFVVRRGSRAEVDARFRGMMTSVSAVMTPEREKMLGKRLF